jgi:site-specific DNA recombinase
MKAAVYIRVSTEEQVKEGYSIRMQKRVLEEYCDYRGYEVCEVYLDEGITGRSSKRPQFLEMLKDAKQGRFSTIVVFDLSRLSRSLRDLLNTLHLLEDFGVGLESKKENVDTKTAFGRLILSVLGAINQMESDITSERVSAAALQRAIEGKRTAHDVLGYDLFGKDSFSINEAEAEIVRYVFSKYTEFRNFKAVAECYQLLDYRGTRGGKITAETVKKILTLPLYIGFNALHGQHYKGDFEPIIDIKTYNRVQILLGRSVFDISKVIKPTTEIA